MGGRASSVSEGKLGPNWRGTRYLAAIRVGAVHLSGFGKRPDAEDDEAPPGRPVGPLTLSSQEIRPGGLRAGAPACCPGTAAGAWPNRRRPALERSRGAAPRRGRGSRQNRRQREVVSCFLHLPFSAWLFARRHYRGAGQSWAPETADPFFLSPGDFGYLEHLDTREGHHERSHA